MRRSFLLVILALSACPPAAGPDASLAYFRANPDTIAPGNSTQLEWSAANVKSCTISPDIGEVPPEGTRLVTPETSTNYLIDCGNLSAAAIVTVLPKVAITSFTATPGEVATDGTAHLAWSTQGADHCTIFPSIGTVEVNAAADVQVGASTTWTLTCFGFGGPVNAAVSVSVLPITYLDPPTELTLTAGDGLLTATWKQPLGSTDLYLAEAGGITKETIGALDAGVLLHKVSSPLVLGGLANGQAYFVRVAAVSGTVQSDLSTEATGTPLAQPNGSTDTYYGDQWHLKNTGQNGAVPGEDIDVEAAWDSGVRGETVRIAIVDEGVDQGHEDLRANVRQGFSYDYIGHAPLGYAQHGTCVAGLVAARDYNGLGVRGVAPRASIVSYNVLQDLTSDNEYDSMVRGKELNFASNNSWGDAADGTGQATSPDPLWLAGVQEGTSTGRGGKGTVYLWAAGNGGDERHKDRADYDGQANSYYVHAIAGVGDDGVKASYSEEGSNVLVATPTEGNSGQALTTTDITGALGYNDGTLSYEHPNPNYSSTMNGTSASTPVAAGVVALVLQANPALTWRDVRRVLAYSARKNDPTDGDWTLNGAGLHVNHKYGFGVADAQAAVTLARTFTAGAPVVDYATAFSTPNAAIPDNDATGVSNAITVSGSGIAKLDFVEVTVTIAHPRSGDLDLVLAHAGGASSVFFEPHTCDRDPVTKLEACTQLDGYVFGSVRHLDEAADGTWTLTARDRTAANTGSLTKWKLTLHGRP